MNDLHIPTSGDSGPVAARLANAGFVDAAAEAEELVEWAAADAARLEAGLARRLCGEPLAWVTGHAEFSGLRIGVAPGVYVPRWHSEALARRAAERLPAEGAAVDVCTGSGALALVLMARRPRARVVACDTDDRAVACAAANGVEVYRSDLLDALPAELAGAVDVVAGVVPHVPAGELGLLQRDTFAFESALAYDGGADGASMLRRVIADSPRFLRPGGALLLETGGSQPELVRDDLAAAHFGAMTLIRDEEGDARGLEATFTPPGR